MSLFDVIRSILGSKPVRVGDLAATVIPSRPMHRAAAEQPVPVPVREDIRDIEVIPEYRQIAALIEAQVPLLFVTGGAGTGKSTLIRYLRNVLPHPLAVVAPTGVAALNAGGATIHSFFRLPPRVVQPSDVKKIFDRQLYRKLRLLIVDEVSMVRPDLLDGVDRFLRINRDNNTPFGGVQILLTGDLFQLSPIAKNDEQTALRQMGYRTDYFFGSKGLKDCHLVPLILTRAFRQSDPAFIALLNDLRQGRRVSDVLAAVNARCMPPKEAHPTELVLTCTNHVADKRNRAELLRLSGPERVYMGSISGKFQIQKQRLPSPLDLTLRPGARVMFTKNDGGGRWVNGTLGRVVRLDERSVHVIPDDRSDEEVFEVMPVTWEQYRYEHEPTTDQIVARVVARYTQIPLMLAWAVTIHKAQGKTLSRVFIDLGSSAFATGQVYVALSRVRKLDDIRLARPIRPEEIQCAPEVSRFYKQLVEMTTLSPNKPPA